MICHESVWQLIHKLAQFTKHFKNNIGLVRRMREQATVRELMCVPSAPGCRLERMWGDRVVLIMSKVWCHQGQAGMVIRTNARVYLPPRKTYRAFQPPQSWSWNRVSPQPRSSGFGTHIKEKRHSVVSLQSVSTHSVVTKHCTIF